jgi:hypothetical protein
VELRVFSHADPELINPEQLVAEAVVCELAGGNGDVGAPGRVWSDADGECQKQRKRGQRRFHILTVPPLEGPCRRDYPDNIGHIDSPGCFRCHDDNHKSKDGKKISQDCDTCHKIE